ncbi:MAG TPA: VOC family protein [Acidimicrobiia bacterium]|jgi:catechol 2,3-dioxygenase-like lactoylglutathione lyase family enzyme
MGFHHVAITTRDADATHAFYTDVMGFRLVRVEAAPSAEGGWARHLFYDTGNGECLAVWELHDNPSVPGDFDPSISRGLGLPSWTNHLAFAVEDLAALAATRDRWRSHGYDVLQIDHGWCTSIYLDDPNGIAVECCCTTRAFTGADAAQAEQRRRAARPALDAPPDPEVYEAATLAAR